tara:strand:- start:44 stop:631 length:588 start_codon:yes stop_codon:yes gene_type:complete
MTTPTQTKTIIDKTIIDTKAVFAQAGKYTKSVLGNDRDAVKMIDVLIASNVPETHLISPDNGPNKHLSTASSEFFTGLKAAIEAEYPAQVKALLAMSSKAAGNRYVGAANRTTWRNKANSVIGGMRTAYINRLKAQGLVAAGKMGANARTKPAEVKVTELLVDARSRIQKADAFKCALDLDTVISQLNAMIKAIG